MKVFYTGLCVLLANNGNRISISIPAPDGFGCTIDMRQAKNFCSYALPISRVAPGALDCLRKS